MIGALIGAHIDAQFGVGGESTTLSISITDSSDPVPINTSFTYSVIVTNTGTSNATNLSVSISPDISIMVTSKSGSGWTFVTEDDGSVTANRIFLSPGAAPTIIVTVTSGSSAGTISTGVGAIANNASIVSASQDTSVIVPQTSLSVTLTDSVDPVLTAINYTYSAVVTNTGSNDATSITATITLDASLTFVSGSGTGWVVGAVGQVVTCTMATLAPGAAPTITITVTSGGSATTANSTADAIASNSPPATQATQATQVKLVTRDAAGAFRAPASLTEWQSFNAYWVAVGLANFPNLTPDSLYLCQESSGNLADSIGSVTLTANGSPTYQQTVSNCTRNGIGFSGAANQRCTAASGSGPNPATTSTMWLWRLDITSAPGSTVNVLLVSDGAINYRLLLTTTPKFQSAINGATNNGTSDPRTGFTMWADIQYDKTNLKSTCHTSQEKITNTFSSGVVDGRKGLGGATSWTGHAVYGVRFDGSKGEMSDAQIKALHTALNDGVAPPWS